MPNPTAHASAPPSTFSRQALDDVLRDSLLIALPATVAVVWGWTAYVLLFQPQLTQTAYIALALAVATLLASYWLHSRSLHSAINLYLTGLVLIATTIMLSVGASAATLLYVPVVVAAAMLSGTLVTVAVSVLCSVLATWAGLHAGLDPISALLPAVLIWLTALAVWLSSRRLFTVLGWALNATQQAQKSAEDARNHRAELKRVLQTLDIAYEQLERANRALIFAQEAAEQAYRFKSEFVANVSHELRTPLNLIVGFSEMMATAPESYGGVTLPREYRGDMMATYRSASHLLDLINDVLDLSQIEAGQLPLTREPTDLIEIVQEATGIVKGLADARGLKLETEMPAAPLVLGLDRTRIRQVLLNLLTNAMRYTERGWVRVRVTLQDAVVNVCVEDSGRGIDPHNLQRAFEAFSRLDEEQIRDGSGLGLAISKKFIEMHEGHISIESELGKGTRVSFTLPLPETQLMPLSALHLSRSLTQPHQRPRALLLHDDRRTLALLRRHIDGCDFTLRTATTPKEMQHDLPHAIITDPDWKNDHLQVLEQLQAPNHTLVITCPLPSMRRLGVLMGVDDFLPKPVTRDDLAAALARLAGAAKTALVVDDDPHIVRLIGRMLKTIDPNLHIYEAYGGSEGLEIARSQQPDVIFLDLGMPQMSGYALIDALTQDDDAPHIPIVVVSVRSIEEEATPLNGEIRIQRTGGFTLTEILQMLNIILHELTRPGAVSPASAAARLQASLGSPAS